MKTIGAWPATLGANASDAANCFRLLSAAVKTSGGKTETSDFHVCQFGL